MKTSNLSANDAGLTERTIASDVVWLIVTFLSTETAAESITPATTFGSLGIVVESRGDMMFMDVVGRTKMTGELFKTLAG